MLMVDMNSSATEDRNATRNTFMVPMRYSSVSAATTSASWRLTPNSLSVVSPCSESRNRALMRESSCHCC